MYPVIAAFATDSEGLNLAGLLVANAEVMKYVRDEIDSLHGLISVE
jgi:hypothetical protein